MTNRLHSATRWPKDAFVRRELAEVDLFFLKAMYKLGFNPNPASVEIQGRAQAILAALRTKKLTT